MSGEGQQEGMAEFFSVKVRRIVVDEARRESGVMQSAPMVAFEVSSWEGSGECVE